MAQFGKTTFGNGVSWVNGTQAVLFGLKQRKSSEAEEGMEDVHGVSWSIADASLFILAVQDEIFKGLLVDPVLLLHHAHG